MTKTEALHRRRLRRWITALRSGRYKQGQGQLRKTESKKELWCCLGVACDIAKKDLKTDWRMFSYRWQFLGNSGTLPSKVIKYYGLDASDPSLNKDRTITCTVANDGSGGDRWSFKKIALALERRYLKTDVG